MDGKRVIFFVIFAWAGLVLMAKSVDPESFLEQGKVLRLSESSCLSGSYVCRTVERVEKVERVEQTASCPLRALVPKKMPAYQSQDSVQAVLRRLAKTHPEKVSFIVETYRWHLNNPRPEAVSDDIRIQLQDAFYYDIGRLCKFYGQKYLMNWEAIASKAARETFWGTSYLCNRAFNYFGIRRINKPWTCDSFGFCQAVNLKDPTPSEFVVFSDFESSLWMFIHTAYSAHFLDRLPDYGLRVGGALIYERRNGIHYWETAVQGNFYADQLIGDHYTLEEIIYTWSGHEVNNLCVECSWESDMNWVAKLRRAQLRARQ